MEGFEDHKTDSAAEAATGLRVSATASDDEDDLSSRLVDTGRVAGRSSAKCPFLDTVNRHVLDFDMQKVCSVTLSPNHVYACLVCGKYFEGRGRHTPAYTHALQAEHHVFISLSDGRVWCLPDGYEVTDASLADIKYALDPRFLPAQLASLDTSSRLSRDMQGVPYLPGFVGLNNLRKSDYANAVVQALAHVPPLRDFFLQPSNYASCPSPLVQRFGALLRRIWSPASFKSTVSPVELMAEVSTRSRKRFTASEPAEASEFIVWLLNTLHSDLTARDAGQVAAEAAAAAVGGAGAATAAPPAAAGSSAGGKVVAAAPKGAASSASSSSSSSIITDVFQGELEVTLLSSELEAEKEKEKAKAKAKEKAKARGMGGSDSDSDSDGDAAGAAASAPSAKRPRVGAEAGAGAASASSAPASSIFPKVSRLPFLFLSLDLPAAPLFADDGGAASIAQVPLLTLLSKYDGSFVTDSLRGQYRERRRFRVTRLPPYVIMTVKRFARNAFFAEKNPTIVNTPVRNLELRPCMHPAALARAERERDAARERAASALTRASASAPPALPSLESLDGMKVSELRALLARLRPSAGPSSDAASSPLEKGELLASARAALSAALSSSVSAAKASAPPLPPDAAAAVSAASKASASAVTKFDLIASVLHDNPPATSAEQSAGGKAADPLATGSYRVHAQHGCGAAPSSGQWYELQDLHVSEALPQMVGIAQAYILIFRRQAPAAAAGGSGTAPAAEGNTGAAAAAGAGDGKMTVDGAV